MATTTQTKLNGTYTAIVTPFTNDGKTVNRQALRTLLDFQRDQGARGIVVAGTTGESPTLSWSEQFRLVDRIMEWNIEHAGSKMEVIASTGSNSTQETIEATRHVVTRGAKSVLLVDPYYNGPSSLEIKNEYYAPLLQNFPFVNIIPYIIPGRTGTQLSAEHLAMLTLEYPNLSAVKDATGDIEYARKTRTHAATNLSILSGDDDKTLTLMQDPQVRASGVISVISNIAPKAVQEMTESTRRGDWKRALQMHEALKPLFEMVTIKTMEDTPFGEVPQKARNPVPIKTMMNILGMEAGETRAPLGKVTPRALNTILAGLQRVQSKNPEILEPIGNHFDVKVEERLTNARYRENLSYAPNQAWSPSLKSL